MFKIGDQYTYCNDCIHAGPCSDCRLTKEKALKFGYDVLICCSEKERSNLGGASLLFQMRNHIV